MGASDKTEEREALGATYAGRPITGAMYPFSGDLMNGTERFARMANEATQALEIRTYNAAAVTFAVSAVDAKVNEWIAISREIEDAHQPAAFWNEIAELSRTIDLKRKWNLLASLNGATLWDSGKEPFQSYEVAVALRNEIVHFKGEFLGKNEAPSRRIEGLMTQLGVESDGSFVEADGSSWVYDLLMCPALGQWVATKMRPFYDDVYHLLLGGTNHRIEPMR